MELISLQLKNFRQYCDTTLEFAIGDDKPVTVVHGPNGSGKTSLLNAFPWILYGNVDFEHGIEHLPNEGAMAQLAAGETIRVEGILTFKHDKTTYRAIRWAELRKEQDGELHGVLEDDALFLEEEQQSGGFREVKNPGTRLKQILPDRLSDLFFFDGEDIDELAGVDNQERVQEAIQNIMGITILERAIRHLGTVEGKYEDQMEEFGSDELRRLVNEKRELEQANDDRRQEITTLKETKSTLDGEINDIKAKLGELEESSDLEEERVSLEERRDELEAGIEEVNDEIRAAISDSAYLEFAMPAIRATAEDLDDLRAEGHIPSELSNEFVDRLLDIGDCICNRPLEEGTEAYEAVESWKSEFTIEGLDQAAIRLISHLEHIAVGRSELFESLDDLVNERQELQDQVDDLTESIDEVGTQLQGLEEWTNKDQESPAQLERTREQKAEELEETKERIIRIDQQIQDTQEEIDTLERRIAAEEEEKGKALTAKCRREAAQAVRKELESHFEDLQSTVRSWSDSLVKETFNQIARKDLRADITDDFKLLIRQYVGDDLVEVDKSTGERQIASLAFIGSLVSIARERAHSSDDSPYFKGGIYPIVMDSPFGALDKDHRRYVARMMPDLAKQVVVFATDSQWEGPVAEEMKPYVGSQYWLDFDNGEGANNFPVTRVKSEQSVVAGGDR